MTLVLDNRLRALLSVSLEASGIGAMMLVLRYRSVLDPAVNTGAGRSVRLNSSVVCHEDQRARECTELMGLLQDVMKREH
jgi:hypothetical protein